MKLLSQDDYKKYKESRHNDPFEYDSYENESFWDFSWKYDWPLVVLAALVIVAAGAFYWIVY